MTVEAMQRLRQLARSTRHGGRPRPDFNPIVNDNLRLFAVLFRGKRNDRLQHLPAPAEPSQLAVSRLARGWSRGEDSLNPTQATERPMDTVDQSLPEIPIYLRYP